MPECGSAAGDPEPVDRDVHVGERRARLSRCARRRHRHLGLPDAGNGRRRVARASEGAASRLGADHHERLLRHRRHRPRRQPCGHLPVREQALVRSRPQGDDPRGAEPPSAADREPRARRRGARAARRHPAPEARARTTRARIARHHARALDRGRRRAARGMNVSDHTAMSAKFTTHCGRIADLDWIRALYELGQKAANGAHPQQVSQEILEHIVRGFAAESGSIALIVDGTVDQLELAAGTDLPSGLIGKELPRGTGVFGHVVATGQPVLVNGNAAETGLPLRGSAERQRSTHSAMCWPLQVAGRTIGAVAVNRAETSPRYTPDDLEQGQALTSLLALVMANHRMHVERDARILELSTLNATMQRINAMLEDAQNQVIQSEKLASIGQMAAGVAHEINNPLAFALSNLGSLEAYLASLFELLDAYVDADASIDASGNAALATARKLRAGVDVAFLRSDTADLVAESREGLLRVKRIVQDLRDFSRGGAEEVRQALDIHDALDRTLNIVRNELKYKANIVREYGALPEIECVPSRLNQ